MRRFVGLTALYCCAFVAPITLTSQSAPPSQRPYVTISRMTVYVAEPGKAEVVKDIIRKTEARDGQGRRYSSAGSNLPPRFRYDWIRDVVAGRSYQVNREQKVAYFTALDPTDSGPDLSNSEMRAVEINGVRCLEGPARQVRPGGGSDLIGTTCVSVELGNLLVHEDHRVNLGGEYLHIVSELEDLQMDTEPLPDWFRIPGDFRLVPGDPAKPTPHN